MTTPAGMVCIRTNVTRAEADALTRVVARINEGHRLTPAVSAADVLRRAVQTIVAGELPVVPTEVADRA